MKGIISELKSRNLTIKWLANKLNVDRATIWRWDKGDNCKPAYQHLIKQLLENEDKTNLI